jgi:uncharacterized protein (DUF2132 family)
LDALSPDTDKLGTLYTARHFRRRPRSQMSKEQPKNPLHGVTLEMMIRLLVTHYGWDELGRSIPVRCFQENPSMGSSLKFLRRTPWARERVEALYLRTRFLPNTPQ